MVLATSYSITVVLTGILASQQLGEPGAPQALWFAAGAFAAFSLIAVLGGPIVADSEAPNRLRHPLWLASYAVSAAIAIGSSWLAVELIQTDVAWPVTGFIATSVQLLVNAFFHALATREANPGK